MEIYEIINDFIDLNDLRNNKRILAFILYGSYVNNSSNNLSDVDVLMVLDGKENYRAAKMFEGLHFDIHALSVREVERQIVHERANGNGYIESVLRCGVGFINNEHTLDYLRMILGVKNERYKRTLNPFFATIAIDAGEDFLDSPTNDDFKYFKALENLRKIIHIKMKANSIPEQKVYKLYSNVTLAKDGYLIKLPNQEFRTFYLNALNTHDFKERKENIIKMFSYIIGIKLGNGCPKDTFYSDKRIKELLVTLNHLVVTAEDNIIKATPYANPLYFLTIDRILGVIEYAQIDVLGYVSDLFNKAVNATSENDRIKCLEELFHVVDSKYDLDYDDFVLKLCINK